MTPSEPLTAPPTLTSPPSPSHGLHAPGVVARQRLHPLSPVLDLVVYGWRLWPVLVVSALNDFRVALLGPAVLALLGWRFVAWRRTWWQLHDGVLRVESGVLSRSTRLVPADRVQQVEIVRKLRHQAFGVAAVRVDLAGGSDPSVLLDVLSMGAADRLRTALELHRRGAVPAGPSGALPPPEPPAQEVLRLDGRLLALGGMSGFGLLVVPAALMAVFDVLSDLRLTPDGPDGPVRIPLVGLVAAVGFGLVLWVATGAVVGIVQHNGFTVERRGPAELAIRRGLLERRTSVVPLRRVQRLEVHANPVRRAFRLVRVAVSTASTAGGGDGVGDAHPGVPVVRRAALPSVLDLFLDGAGAPVTWTVHPPAARRRAVWRRLRALWVLVAVVAWFTHPGVLVAGVPAAAVLAVVWGRAWHRRLGFAVDLDAPAGPLLHVRSGVVSLRRSVLLCTKVQSIRTAQSPWQRRAGLVTVWADVTGSPMYVEEVGVDQAAHLVAVLRRFAEVR